MPTYEIAFIVKSAFYRSMLKSAVKGACDQVLQQGGIIRQIENLGYRELPHMIENAEGKHRRGHYFCVHFDSTSEAIAKIDERFRQEHRILRFGVVKKQTERRRPCLDGPCIFGEIPNPDHDRTAYTRSVLARFRNKKMSNI